MHTHSIRLTLTALLGGTLRGLGVHIHGEFLRLLSGRDCLQVRGEAVGLAGVYAVGGDEAGVQSQHGLELFEGKTGLLASVLFI